jgi:glycosyltransferase involved in cell wall biosynthesis
VKKDEIKTLVISDSPIANVQGIWCFNHLSKNIKLGLIKPKQLMIKMSFFRLIMKYLRIFTFTYFFSPNWDVIISTSFADGFGLSIFQLLGFRRKTKHIVIDQAALSANTFFYPILPIIMRWVSKIICYTSAQANWWKSRLGSNKAVFIPYAIEERVDMQGTDEKEYIFSGGASSRDYATLIKAAKKIKMHFIVIAVKDSVTRKNSLEGISIPQNVSVYPMIPREKFLKLIRESKIVVIPLEKTIRAGGQSVLLEAFAAGKPVIASRTAGMEDYIEDGKTGILVPYNNPKELEKAICLLNQNENLRKNLGKNARKAFETKYNIKKIGNQVSKLLEEVISIEDKATKKESNNSQSSSQNIV